VVRRLTDWYQIPFVSFGSMIRPRLYQEEGAANHHSLVVAAHSTNNNKALSIASLLAFATLQFTIDYCSQEHLEVPTSPLLKPGVQHLVETVVPPALDLDLTLQEVSAKWKAAAEEQANCSSQTTTTTTSCPVAFMVSKNYNKTIQNTQVAAHHGWISSSDNQLLLSSSQANTNFWTTPFRIDRPDVFQIVVENASSDHAKLQIQLEPASSSREKTISAVVETAAPDDGDGAVSHRIDLSSSWKGPLDVTLTLRLLQGDSIRIVSLFVCNAPMKTNSVKG
jgi:hypothetical protein